MTLSSNQLASLYLRTMGAPDTPAMRNVMKAWFRAEGGPQDNPMNLAGFEGPCGSRHNANHTFPIFCSPEQGAIAWRDRLSSPNHGYPRITKGLKSGDPVQALAAIVGSGWVTGDTGLKQYQYTRSGKHYNSLVISYNGMGGVRVKYETVLAKLDTMGGVTGKNGKPAGPTEKQRDYVGEFLASIGRQRSDPIREQDIMPFLDFMQKEKVIGDKDVAWLGLANTLAKLVGKGGTWNDLGGSVMDAAAAVPTIDKAAAAANAIPDAIGGAVDALTKVFGVMMALVVVVGGAWLYTRSQRQQIQVVQ